MEMTYKNDVPSVVKFMFEASELETSFYRK